MIEIFLNLVVFILVILCSFYYFIHNKTTSNNQIYYNYVNNSKILSQTDSRLPVLGEKFAAAYDVQDDDGDGNDEMLFLPCDTENDYDTIITRNAEDIKNNQCLSLTLDVYDKHTGKIILKSGKRRHILPNSETIPRTCGFGKLTFDKNTNEWKCVCNVPDYFGGEHCDHRPHVQIMVLGSLTLIIMVFGVLNPL